MKLHPSSVLRKLRNKSIVISYHSPAFINLFAGCPQYMITVCLSAEYLRFPFIPYSRRLLSPNISIMKPNILPLQHTIILGFNISIPLLGIACHAANTFAIHYLLGSDLQVSFYTQYRQTDND